MRVFVAVKLDERLKLEIGSVAEDMEKICGEGRFADPANYHVTLEFIGEVDKSKIKDIESVMDHAAMGATAFELGIEGLGSFKKGRTGILWFGIGAGRVELTELDGKLRSGLRQAGFRTDDRNFNPHLTIGRKVALKEPLGCEHRGGWIQTVEGIVLMESARRNGRLVYTPIYESRFGK